MVFALPDIAIKLRRPGWLVALLLAAVVWAGVARAESGSAETPPSDSLSSDTLIFAFWTNATPPFAVTKGEQLVDGIIFDLGNELAKRLNRKAVFRLLPTKRVEREVLMGGVDLDCVSSPIWKETPDDYGWSPALFDGADRFLVRTDTDGTIESLADLQGLRVGTYPGYVYHPDIMKMLENGEAQRVTVNDVDHGIRLLLADRIDTLIDFGVLLRYQLKEKDLGNKLSLAPLPADEFQLMCAYSPKMKVEKPLVDLQLQSMVDDQTISRILAKYQ